MLSSADISKKHIMEMKQKNQSQPDHLVKLRDLVGKWRDRNFYVTKLKSTENFYPKLEEWINLYIDTYISNLNTNGLPFAESQAAKDFVNHSF